MHNMATFCTAMFYMAVGHITFHVQLFLQNLFLVGNYKRAHYYKYITDPSKFQVQQVVYMRLGRRLSQSPCSSLSLTHSFSLCRTSPRETIWRRPIRKPHSVC